MVIYIWLGLVLILVVALFLRAPVEGFEVTRDEAEYNYIRKNGINFGSGSSSEGRDSESPNNATMQIISSKIPNAPQPPNVDMTDAVVYAPVDQVADIKTLKKKLANVQRNLPGDIADATYGLLSPMLGNILRQSGFPLTDDTYAQIYDCSSISESSITSPPSSSPNWSPFDPDADPTS